MRSLFPAVFLATILGEANPAALADGLTLRPTVIGDFTIQPETRWRFFTDQVMGACPLALLPPFGKMARPSRA